MGRLRPLRGVVAVGLIEIADLPQLDPMVGDVVQIGRHGLDEIGLPILAEGSPMLAGLAEIVGLGDRFLLRRAGYRVFTQPEGRLRSDSAHLLRGGWLIVHFANLWSGAHASVLIVVGYLRQRTIGWQFLIVRTNAVTLRIRIGEQAALQHLVRRRFDTGNHNTRRERRLFSILE